MKKIKKGQEPHSLITYKSAKPNAKWEEFRDERSNYTEIKRQLIDDQNGLCAYCEIDLKQTGSSRPLDDFRVEHFIPKSQNPPPNWALEWNNLIGVCHGGRQRGVVDEPLRFGEASCDAYKGGKNLQGVILNPLHVPIGRIFKYELTALEEKGKMMVDLQNCPQAMQSQAQNTIDDLHLNVERLRRMREAVIEGLIEQISLMTSSGKEISEVMETLVRSQLRKRNNSWPAFFSTIRCFFGETAECYLASINYDG
ncbi:retron Ec78 anti-phage system effector HNH endonuclease PtuB [Bacteroides sp.]|uniref:retron Ec78 anti-phage system effector HNH endonuclease PtuB n=1 Tax=Bacteroides sp. TaxID=29523 RepID=UPI00262E3EAB|nr:retron Ec78 anti-phage system effector HNH endonuclease PtuB [Bacteroides sp.]MDD3041029.1 TIGR02646 family protein [Bacteroides sp.]